MAEVPPEAPRRPLAAMQRTLSSRRMLVLGGGQRSLSSLLREGTNAVFAVVAQGAVRRFGRSTFDHVSSPFLLSFSTFSIGQWSLNSGCAIPTTLGWFLILDYLFFFLNYSNSKVHSLDLEYHLNRNTGALARVLERGSRSISFALNAMVRPRMKVEGSLL